jgi:hypothetical protein
MNNYFKINGLDVGLDTESVIAFDVTSKMVSLISKPFTYLPEYADHLYDFDDDNIQAQLDLSGIVFLDDNNERYIAYPQTVKPEVSCWGRHAMPNPKDDIDGFISLKKGVFHLDWTINEMEWDADYENRSVKSSLHIEVKSTYQQSGNVPIVLREFRTLEEALSVAPEEVKSLNLHQQHLDAFPLEVLAFTHLEHLTLQLSGRNRQDLPENIGQLQNLQSLTLWGQKNIQHLPDSFAELTKLTSLELRGFGFTLFPAQLLKLTNLQFLSFLNQVVTIPETIGQLEQLHTLQLGRKLTNLPASIGLLPKLERLNIRSNQFETLPESLNTIPKVNIEGKYKILYQPDYQQAGIITIQDEDETYGFALNKAVVSHCLSEAYVNPPESVKTPMFCFEYEADYCTSSTAKNDRNPCLPSGELFLLVPQYPTIDWLQLAGFSQKSEPNDDLLPDGMMGKVYYFSHTDA